MGSTLTEKLLARAAGRDSVEAGDTVWVDVDLILTHDVFGPDVFRIFEKEFGADAKVFDPDKIVVVPDHYIFTSDTRANRNVKTLSDYVEKHGIRHFYPPHTPSYRGVCHVTVAELGFTRPGLLMLGTDSHTCTAGAFGMFATGVGNTDAAFSVATGKQWLKVPQSMRFELTGKMPPWLMAKDIILEIIGRIGVGGASYMAMEFAGDTLADLSIEERMTLCNMAIEAGGKNGVVPADERTVEFIRSKGQEPAALFNSDDDASFASRMRIDVSKMEPNVAKPHSPDNLDQASRLGDVALDRCYVGSCTGGKLGDFVAAAEILNNREVRVETLIVPATTEITEGLDRVRIGDRTLREIFLAAGCRIGPPSCGACLGGPMDTLGRAREGERVLSTSNRNFPGRMGSMQSEVYLASPLTVAASALTGRISDPRDHMQ